MYIAHSSPDDHTLPHFLKAHTDGVVKRAAAFSERFDPFGMAHVGALMHDQGKKSAAFQTYIQSENKVRGNVKHALGGAVVLYNLQDEQGDMDEVVLAFTSLIVMGHHAGLSNFSQLNQKIKKAPAELKEIGALAKEESEQAVALIRKSMDHLNLDLKKEDAQWYFSTLVRLCFSCMVDADWLDTESYFNPEKLNRRNYKAPNMLGFLEVLNRYMVKLEKAASSSHLNTIRKKVYENATRRALADDNFFALHAPTGSGKTLASLSFALNHAKKHEKSRVIFALPLTNLTEQTSEIYRNILGDEHVIEHHSQVDLGDTLEEMNKARLATENWDRPFIVTTTVQLFESLFSNQPNRTRKLHRIANSIIVLDEYQKLPLPLLKPILFMLKILREQFDVTVLFMSATPLALEQSEVLKGVGKPVEILEQPQAIFKKMQRVQYKQIEQSLDTADLVAKMKNHHSVLCIVNTRKDAQKIYDSLTKSRKRWDRIYHISTTMCSDHRLKVIKEIKALTNNPASNKSIAVISTAVMEAGVDLTFDAVFRMYGPLDSIIQAAGRCNRENELEKGIVYLFDLIDSRPSGPFYAQSTEVTKQLLEQTGVSALQNPTACIRYFRKIYSNTAEDGLDIHQINGEKLFAFKQIANDFKMLDDEKNVSVLCTMYSNFPHEIFEQEGSSRSWYRKMQPYMIPLSKKTIDILKLDKVNDLYVWQGSYDTAIGYEL